MRQLIGFIFAVAAITCLVAIKYVGIIGEASLVVLLLASCLIWLFIGYSNRVKSFSLRNGELVLSEIQQRHEKIIEIEHVIRELASATMAISEANKAAGWAMSEAELQQYTEAKNRLATLLR